jgi:hypothetical protein
MTIDPARYLTREMQFCTLCAAQGKGWVRVIHVGEQNELRKGRTFQAARDAYRARRRRAIVRHYREVHPDVKLT